MWPGGERLQTRGDGSLKHLLTLEGIPHKVLTELLDRAESFMTVTNRPVKKAPLLRGDSIVNLFFENSTRTRVTFELAAKRLAADVLNVNVAASSQSKGESFLDMIDNLQAMHVDGFIIRHPHSGAAHRVARHVDGSAWVVNAGDGWYGHPTQGLLDLLTIRRERGPIHQLRVVIVGDVLHSRVARSQIYGLAALGCPEIRVVAPKTLLPPSIESLGVHVYHDLDKAIEGMDVVSMLRLQKERMDANLLPSFMEYRMLWGLTKERLARAAPDAIVLHPGPMNRGLEIDSEVADSAQAKILPQVTLGLAVRMAVLTTLAERKEEES